MMSYESYKNSGNEWLGDVPEHWKNYRIDWVAAIVRGNTGFKKDELLSDGAYIALQYGKTYKVDVVDNTFKFFVNSEFYKKGQTVSQGDTILISTSETIEDLGHSCFYHRDKAGLLGGEQILLKPDNKILSEKYLYYYSKKFTIELRKYATGLKVFRFNTDDLKQISIAIPQLEEQKKIAEYLDVRTKAIDEKVNLLEQKIEYYKELRKSLINVTVTKGLDKTATLKDSGIDWIGQIPEHWDSVRLSDLSKENKKKNKGLVSKNLLSLSYGHIVLRPLRITK
jgi:type I restriction enzyme S subunit